MADGPKYGRRAAADTAEGDAPRPVVKGWGEDTALTRDESFAPGTSNNGTAVVSGDPVDLPTLDGGVDEAAASAKREEDDSLAREVAAAPVEYHTAMPKLSELDLGLKWSKIHAKCSEEVDMACLTQVLCQQLDDEDVAWQPDMLLVQLTSEFLDVSEQREGDAAGSGGGGGEGVGGPLGSSMLSPTLDGVSRRRTSAVKA